MKTICFTGLLVLCFYPWASASESRSQALLYNLALEDQTDIFLFPNLLPQYQGIYFHLPASVSNVFGGAVLKLGDHALGAFVHRPLLSNFEQYRITVTDANAADVGLLPGNPGEAAEPHLSGQVIDLLYGSGGFGLGLRIHAWSELSKQEGVLGDPAETDSAFTTDANVAFRLSPGCNLRLNVGYREIKETGSLGRVHLGFRYLEPVPKPVRFVIAGEVESGFFIPTEGDSSFGLAFPLKAGVNYAAISDMLTLGLVVGLDVQMMQMGDTDLKLGLAVPTVEIAVEWSALDWLQLRTAVKGGFGIQFLGDASDNTPKYEQLAFGSGAGFLWGPFRADAVIEYGLWQNGPYFVGGQNGLFAGVTLAYVWGGEEKSPTAITTESQTKKEQVVPPKTEEESAPQKIESEQAPNSSGASGADSTLQ